MPRVSTISTIEEAAKKAKHKTNKVRTVGFELEKCVLYSCLRHTMRLSRWFGFFPVEGLESPLLTGLRYRLRCLYGLFFMLTVVGQGTMVVLNIYQFFIEDMSIPLFTHVVFYMNSLMSSYIMVGLAKKWPVLMKDIAEMERIISGLLEDKYIMLKTAGLSMFFIFFGQVEHSLAIFYAFYYVMVCLNDFSFSYAVWEMYFSLKLSHIPNLVPSNTFIAGALLEITNMQASFMWTFIDVIVMIISYYLVICLKNYNRIIERQKNNKSTDWGLLRSKYCDIIILIKKIDANFNLFVLQSFFTNLFFTCLQLFHTIRNDQISYKHCNPEGTQEALDSAEHTIYFSFSFTFLIIRMVVVALIAAEVNSRAHDPISALGEVHASAYNIEIQRFYRQLTYTTIGLSGVFFYVTRNMILKVLGTLVTYELMLLQFKSSSNINLLTNFTEITTNLTELIEGD